MGLELEKNNLHFSILLVNLCFRKRDGQRFAVKSIKFEKLEDGYTSKTFFNEVNAYNEARHPCIVKMEEVINTDKGTYIGNVQL